VPEQRDALVEYVQDRQRGRVEIAEDGYSLRLGDKVVGHRELLTYYKQRPRLARQSEVIQSVLSDYRLLGWQSKATGKFTQSEKQLQSLRRQSKYYMKIGVKQNRIQPNHSRDQTSIK